MKVVSVLGSIIHINLEEDNIVNDISSVKIKTYTILKENSKIICTQMQLLWIHFQTKKSCLKKVDIVTVFL